MGDVQGIAEQHYGNEVGFDLLIGKTKFSQLAPYNISLGTVEHLQNAMEVQDGLYARRLWTQTILENKNQDQKEEILANLSAYCTLDTFAMVRILENLKKIVAE